VSTIQFGKDKEKSWILPSKHSTVIFKFFLTKLNLFWSHEMIEKRGFLVEYVLVYSQSMALDILGLSIFGYDFKSLTNENGENLKSF
jgi:hypothetical protein